MLISALCGNKHTLVIISLFQTHSVSAEILSASRFTTPTSNRNVPEWGANWKVNWKSRIMIKNVGKIDKTLRFLLGLILVWLGLFVLNGKEGSVVGILVAIISLMPFYMALTGSCFVFRWFKIHSLSKKEYQNHGNPYRDGKEWNKMKNTNNKTSAVLKANSFLLIIYQASIDELGLFCTLARSRLFNI